jgi:phospholipid/cholesterol/gamma-HCH transport system substrate-binding protein
MSDDSAPARPDPIERKALALLLLLAALVAGAVAYVLYARGAFEATQQLVLIVDDAEGVKVGMDLNFSGFPIGRVRRVQLADDGTARIVIDVPLREAHRLRESSVFTLTRGLLGTTHIRAFTGIPTDPPLPPDAERRALVGDAAAELPRLVADTRRLVQNLTDLAAADGAAAQTLANLRDTSARLQGPQGALGVLFGNEADARKLVAAIERTNALLARIDGLVVKAEQQTFGAEGLVPEAQATLAQMNAALAEARASLQRVDAILADGQAIAGNLRGASDELATLRAEVDANLRKLSRMIDEVNRRWPFAREPALELP